MARTTEYPTADDDFQVSVLSDGTITYPEAIEPRPTGSDSSNILAGSEGPTGTDRGCSQKSAAWYTSKQGDPYEWWVGDGAQPGALTQAQAHSAFADIMDNITGSTNSCGLSDQVSAAQTYMGYTTTEADINSSGECTARDGTSTWDAGNLDSGTVAETCWWASGGDMKEADVRFNTTDYDFTTSPSSSTKCGKYDIESVGTHEAGHAFGLAHATGPDASYTNWLTMHPVTYECRTFARSLGYGDVMGLRALY
ncbi:peptidase M10 [Nocardioides marmorisolisilvae]|uniref:Peptidase M10 n=2 Tax=Nocardioides marmorisolisilvae TaxID=1542737 RepID=A0A3N0DXF1_9ACTN|nr:peptidase M10 [Nocardioides marmorisolisilvae]